MMFLCTCEEAGGGLGIAQVDGQRIREVFQVVAPVLQLRDSAHHEARLAHAPQQRLQLCQLRNTQKLSQFGSNRDKSDILMVHLMCSASAMFFDDCPPPPRQLTELTGTAGLHLADIIRDGHGLQLPCKSLIQHLPMCDLVHSCLQNPSRACSSGRSPHQNVFNLQAVGRPCTPREECRACLSSC